MNLIDKAWDAENVHTTVRRRQCVLSVFLPATNIWFEATRSDRYPNTVWHDHGVGFENGVAEVFVPFEGGAIWKLEWVDA